MERSVFGRVGEVVAGHRGVRWEFAGASRAAGAAAVEGGVPAPQTGR
ncbi:hypothetical protein ACFO4E_28805 [Nocardiopsis mangrovi]|uniref:Uncharacterized protein n=1 Tax=Nocardiopsis mangrovi TaxID=1179818 RepID=A0ABV9E6V1_9ACTN